MTSLLPLHLPRAVSKPEVIFRNYSVTALGADGAPCVADFDAPALPLFDSAFTAFAHGTQFTGLNGTVSIEDLEPGDWLHTSTGKPAQVTWIGSANFIPADTGRRTRLIRIMADSFGPNRPGSFVTVGPAARILHRPRHLPATSEQDKMLTPVETLVDNVNVIEITPPTPVRLFHICLSRHAAVDVGGLMMGAYHPGTAVLDGVPDKHRAQFLSMFPNLGQMTDFDPLAHPRITQDSLAAE